MIKFSRIRKSKFFFLPFFVSASISASAQLVSGDVFLKGNFVEVGIAPNGSFGSGGTAPAGYHPRPSPGPLGFVSDPDRDGFAVGSPAYYGDFFLPGTPQEGWAIGISGTYYQAFRGGGASSFSAGLTGSNVSYVDSTYIQKAVWEGAITSSNLQITQTTTLKPDDMFITTIVKLKNTGAATLYSLYYTRTVDPDNDVTLGGSFNTFNTVVNKIPNSTNKVLVQGIGTTFSAAYLGLGAKDARAKPYALNAGLSPTGILSDIFDESGTAAAYHFDTGVTYNVDAGIGVVYKIDSLEAGDSTSLGYAYVLGPIYVDTAFTELSTALPVDFISFDARPENCTVKLSWTYNTSEKIDYFSVERSSDGRQFLSLAQLKEMAGSYVDKTADGQKWMYRIKAKALGGKSYYSGTAAITANECSGRAFSIMPNPANDYISIAIPSKFSEGSFEIENSNGQKVMTGILQSNAEQRIDVRHLPNGVYVFKATADQIIHTSRFTIAH